MAEQEDHSPHSLISQSKGRERLDCQSKREGVGWLANGDTEAYREVTARDEATGDGSACASCNCSYSYSNSRVL